MCICISIYYLITHCICPVMCTVTVNTNVTAWSVLCVLSYSIAQLSREEIIRAKLLRMLCTCNSTPGFQNTMLSGLHMASMLYKSQDMALAFEDCYHTKYHGTYTKGCLQLLHCKVANLTTVLTAGTYIYYPLQR